MGSSERVKGQNSILPAVVMLEDVTSLVDSMKRIFVNENKLV